MAIINNQIDIYLGPKVNGAMASGHEPIQPAWKLGARPKKERKESNNKIDRRRCTPLTATAIPINIRGSFVGEGA